MNEDGPGDGQGYVYFRMPEQSFKFRQSASTVGVTLRVTDSSGGA